MSWRILMSELPSFFCNRKKLEFHKKVCENKDFNNVLMPSEDTKILEFNRYQKLDKTPFIIYADLDYIIEKSAGCKNENSSTTKVIEHIPSDFSMSTILPFRGIENDVYRGKDCMNRICEFLGRHAIKMINSKKKKIAWFINK